MGVVKIRSAKHIFESVFRGAILGYKDPLSFPSVGSIEALQPDHVFVEDGAQPETDVPRGLAFHDFVEPPIFPGLIVGMPPYRNASFVLARKNVTLSGYRTYLDTEGHFHNDESYVTTEEATAEIAHLGRPEVHLNEAAGLRSAKGGYRLSRGGRAVSKISEPVICFGSNESPNYGSFLFRVFPKIAAAQRLDPSLKVLVPMYPPKMAEFLTLAGIDKSRLVPHWFDRLYKLNHAIIPSMRNRNLWMDAETSALFAMMRDRSGVVRGQRKIYVTRAALPPGPSGHGRVMLNEAEVRAAVEDLGFETVIPERLSVADQIATFASASAIVAAGGSALYNAAFCYPGTKYVDIESEPHWGWGHVRWLDSAQLDYGVFEGTPSSRDFSVPHQPFSVDVPRLVRRLKGFV